MNGNGQPTPKVPVQPVPTAAEVARVSFNDGREPAVVLTFSTPTGEQTYFLPFEVARVIQRAIAQIVGGIVLPGPEDRAT